MEKLISWHDVQSGTLVNRDEKGVTYRVAGWGLVWITADIKKQIESEFADGQYRLRVLQAGSSGETRWIVINVFSDAGEGAGSAG